MKSEELLPIVIELERGEFEMQCYHHITPRQYFRLQLYMLINNKYICNILVRNSEDTKYKYVQQNCQNAQRIMQWTPISSIHEGQAV